MLIKGYCRVSTNETKQSCERQVEAMHSWEKQNNIKIDEIVEEYATGKNFDRQLYKQLKEELQNGDVLIVKELDRFGRSMDLIKSEWQYFMDKGVRIIVIDMPLISSDLNGNKTLDMRFIANLVFEVLCYSAEKEREKISQRTKEALAVKKASGVKLGRKQTYSDEFVDMVMSDYINGMKVNDIMKKFNVSRDRIMVWRKQRGITPRNSQKG